MNEAHVLMIVAFSEEIKYSLVYPSRYYDGVALGSNVIAEFFYCSKKECVEKLAEALGIDKVLDFSQHEITHWKINYEKLGGLFKKEEVEKFELCVRSGAQIFFYPDI